MMGLVVDLFAGGGGASVGIEAALGRAVDELLLAFDKFEEHINGSVEWLKEPRACRCPEET